MQRVDSIGLLGDRSSALLRIENIVRLSDMTTSDLLDALRPKSVALFRALQLGDMLCAVPALRALRARLPHAHITLVGLPWAEQFASRFDSYIDDFIVFPGHPSFPEQAYREGLAAGFYDTMRSKKYELAIQMHGSGEISNPIVRDFGAVCTAGFAPTTEGGHDSACFLPYPAGGAESLRLLQLTDFLGAHALGVELEFPLNPEDRKELEKFRLGSLLKSGDYICVHPGARSRDKCWPVQRFAEIADQLAEEYQLDIVLTGSAKEADLAAAVASHMHAPAIQAALPISIGAMAALMNRSRLLICNDTGVSHIAAGLKLPSVVVFSKANMQRWAPLDENRHRCVWDPEGKNPAQVLRHARELLSLNDRLPVARHAYRVRTDVHSRPPA